MNKNSKRIYMRPICTKPVKSWKIQLQDIEQTHFERHFFQLIYYTANVNFNIFILYKTLLGSL